MELYLYEFRLLERNFVNAPIHPLSAAVIFKFYFCSINLRHCWVYSFNYIFLLFTNNLEIFVNARLIDLLLWYIEFYFYVLSGYACIYISRYQWALTNMNFFKKKILFGNILLEVNYRELYRIIQEKIFEEKSLWIMD